MTTAGARVGSLPDTRILFWFILALGWFATMGWRPLLEPDEGRYAEIPREMIATGDWVTPRLNGFKYFEKPPLQYWTTAALYSLAGFSEASSRFWSCTLAFLCLPLVFYFARAEYGSDEAGIGALLALTINPYFGIVGQLNLLDSALAFFVSASLFAYLRARAAPPSTQMRWMVLAALSLALATLSKGLVAPVLVGGTVLIHLLLTRDVPPLRSWFLPITVPLYFAIVAPWFIAVSLRNPEFPEFFFLREHFARYLTDVSDRVEPYWYFLPLLFLAALPWVRYTAKTVASLKWRTLRDPTFSTRWLLAIWVLFTLIFFSISRSKLATYILPAIPALAVLLAPQIADALTKIRSASWICAVIVAALAAGLVVAALGRGPAPPALFAWVAAAAAVALIGALGASAAWVAPVATSILAFQFLMAAYSLLPPERTTWRLTHTIRDAIRPETALFSVGQYRQSLAPYLGRTLRLALYRGELDFGIQREPYRFIPTLAQFEAEWRESSDAVAIVDPPLIETLRTHGVPFRELAQDGRSVAISRH